MSTITRGKYFLDTLEGAFTGDDFLVVSVLPSDYQSLSDKQITIFISLAHDILNALNPTEGNANFNSIREQHFLISARFKFTRTDESRDFRTEMATVREKIDAKLSTLINANYVPKTYTNGAYTLTYKALNVYIDDYFLDDIQHDETNTIGQILISGYITYINNKI